MWLWNGLLPRVYRPAWEGVWIQSDTLLQCWWVTVKEVHLFCSADVFSIFQSTEWQWWPFIFKLESKCLLRCTFCSRLFWRELITHLWQSWPLATNSYPGTNQMKESSESQSSEDWAARLCGFLSVCQIAFQWQWFIKIWHLTSVTLIWTAGFPAASAAIHHLLTLTEKYPGNGIFN